MLLYDSSKNIQSFAIEIYKYLHGLSLTISGQAFKANKTILIMCNESYARNPKTVRSGTETMSFLSPKIWVSQNEKDSRLINVF